MLRRLIASLICFTFSLSNLQHVQAQEFSINQLPVPGTMIGESAPFAPLALKGLVINPQKPLEFQFIVDTGKGPQDTTSIKEEANRLVKYFLAGLTIPEGELWVNLSPYEKNRITTPTLGTTELGRDLLAQDYILKQLTASLIYPEKDLGKEFWSRVYAKAQAEFGTTNIPVNTFNKVWILPDQAQVYENGPAAYVTKSTLKVMLDEDYLARQKHQVSAFNDVGSVGANIVRQIILPEITKEVNTGKNFAPLRQIYDAMILAKWYKETFVNGILDAVYTNKNKTAGVNLTDPSVKEQIYQRYLQAYKKGVFNYIKETSTPQGQIAPRKYFSGGVTELRVHVATDGAMSEVKSDGPMLGLTVDLAMFSIARHLFGAEMFATAEKRKQAVDVIDGILKELAVEYPVSTGGTTREFFDTMMTSGIHVGNYPNGLPYIDHQLFTLLESKFNLQLHKYINDYNYYLIGKGGLFNANKYLASKKTLTEKAAEIRSYLNQLKQDLSKPDQAMSQAPQQDAAIAASKLYGSFNEFLDALISREVKEGDWLTLIMELTADEKQRGMTQGKRKLIRFGRLELFNAQGKVFPMDGSGDITKFQVERGNFYLMDGSSFNAFDVAKIYKGIDELRYVPIGDSYTIGTGAEEQEAWPSVLTKRLQGQGVPVNLIANPAINGWTTQDAIDKELPIFREAKPDFSTLLIGVNDYVQGVTPQDFRQRFEFLLDAMLKELPGKDHLVVVTIPDYTASPAGKAFHETVMKPKDQDGRGQTVGLEVFNAIIKEEAAKRGLQVVDSTPVSDAMRIEKKLISSDNLHPSAAGYVFWENLIAPQIIKNLESLGIIDAKMAFDMLPTAEKRKQAIEAIDRLLNELAVAEYPVSTGGTTRELLDTMMTKAIHVGHYSGDLPKIDKWLFVLLAGAFNSNVQKQGDDYYLVGKGSVNKYLVSKKTLNGKAESIKLYLSELKDDLVKEDQAMVSQISAKDVVMTEQDVRAILKGKKVLLIDKMQEGRIGIKDSLKEYGMGVTETHSRTEASNLLNKHKFNFVVFYSGLNDPNGVAFYNKIKAHKVPTLIYSIITPPWKHQIVEEENVRIIFEDDFAKQGPLFLASLLKDQAMLQTSQQGAAPSPFTHVGLAERISKITEEIKKANKAGNEKLLYILVGNRIELELEAKVLYYNYYNLPLKEKIEEAESFVKQGYDFKVVYPQVWNKGMTLASSVFIVQGEKFSDPAMSAAKQAPSQGVMLMYKNVRKILKGKRVLLVERFGAGNLEAAYLEQQKMKVTLALTKAEALKLLGKRKFDIVLIEEPIEGGVRGEELARAIRESGEKLPIVIASPTVSEDSEEPLEGLKNVQVISNKVSVGTLLGSLARALKDKAMAAENVVGTIAHQQKLLDEYMKTKLPFRYGSTDGIEGINALISRYVAQHVGLHFDGSQGVVTPQLDHVLTILGRILNPDGSPILKLNEQSLQDIDQTLSALKGKKAVFVIAAELKNRGDLKRIWDYTKREKIVLIVDETYSQLNGAVDEIEQDILEHQAVPGNDWASYLVRVVEFSERLSDLEGLNIGTVMTYNSAILKKFKEYSQSVGYTNVNLLAQTLLADSLKKLTSGNPTGTSPLSTDNEMVLNENSRKYLKPSGTLADGPAYAKDNALRMDVGASTFPAASEIVEGIKGAVGKDHEALLIELIEHIPDYLMRTRHVAYYEDGIFVGTGIKPLITDALFAIKEKFKKKMVVATPVAYWGSYKQAIEIAGGEFIGVETSKAQGYKLTVDGLNRAFEGKGDVQKIIILASPNNPSGQMYSRTELIALGQWAVENKAYILSDEIYGLLNNGKAHVSIASLSNKVERTKDGRTLQDLTILLTGLSKEVAVPGLRVGFLSVTKRSGLIDFIRSNYTGAPDVLALGAAEGILKDLNVYRNFTRDHNNFIQRNKAPIEEVLKNNGIEYIEADGALYLFADFGSRIAGKIWHDPSSGQDIQLTTDNLYGAKGIIYNATKDEQGQRGVANTDGKAFGMPGWVRFSIATDETQEAAGKLQQFLNSLKDAAMNTDDIQRGVQEAIFEIVDLPTAEDIKPELLLNDNLKLGFQDLVLITGNLEKVFNMKISTGDIAKWKTVGDIIKYIDAMLNPKASKPDAAMFSFGYSGDLKKILKNNDGERLTEELRKFLAGIKSLDTLKKMLEILQDSEKKEEAKPFIEELTKLLNIVSWQASDKVNEILSILDDESPRVRQAGRDAFDQLHIDLQKHLRSTIVEFVGDKYKDNRTWVMATLDKLVSTREDWYTIAKTVIRKSQDTNTADWMIERLKDAKKDSKNADTSNALLNIMTELESKEAYSTYNVVNYVRFKLWNVMESMYEVQLRIKKGDSAQISAQKGGIDLNQIAIKRTGKTITMQFDPAQLDELTQGGFEGFTPVIINITHISSPFQLLGIKSVKEPQLLAKA